MAQFPLAASREFFYNRFFGNCFIKQSNTTKCTQYNAFSPGYNINTVSLDHIDVYLVRLKHSTICILIRANRPRHETMF